MRAELVDFLAAGLTDSSGNALNAGKVYTYSAGTVSDKATWLDNLKASQAANPIILDSAGRKQIYADGNYKFVIKDSADNTLYTWDNVAYGLDDGSSIYGGTTTGAANTYIGTFSPAMSELATGTRGLFKAHQTSTTTTPTLNLNSTGAKTITNPDGSALDAGDIVIDQIYDVMYDGTNYRLIQLPSVYGTWTPTIAATGGMTVSATNITHSTYHKRGKHCTCFVTFQTTLAGVADIGVTMTLPFTAASSLHVGGSVYINNPSGTIRQGHVAGSSTTVVAFRRYDNANYTAASNTAAIIGSVEFQIA